MRGGNFTAANLSGVIGWYKADAITGLSDGDSVSSWADSSGEGNTLTQSVSGAQPSYQTDELFGKPVVRFDKDASPGDNMLNADMGGDFDVGTGDFYLALVAKFPTTSGNQFVMTKATGTQGLTVFINGSGTLLFRPQTSGVTTNNIQQTNVTDNEFHVIVCRRVSGVITGHYDGQAFTTDDGTKVNNGSIDNDNDFRLGSSSTGGLDTDMDLSEALLATGTLTDSDRDKLTGYLAWKYGLQTKLPNDHPYRFNQPKRDVIHWTGGGDGQDLTDPDNYSGNVTPAAGDRVVFDQGSNVIGFGSITADSVSIGQGFTGSIGTASSSRTFTVDTLVCASDAAELHISAGTGADIFVTNSANVVRIEGSPGRCFVRSRDEVTLEPTAVTSLDVRHPSGKGGICFHESGTPTTTVGFGGIVERNVASNGDILTLTGNGQFDHLVGSMPVFTQRGGVIRYSGSSLEAPSDIIGGVFKLGRSDQAVIAMESLELFPLGTIDLTGTGSGAVDFLGSKALFSRGGTTARLGPGRTATLS